MRFLFLCYLCFVAPLVHADASRPQTVSDTIQTLLTAVRDAGFPNAAINFPEMTLTPVASDPDTVVSYPSNLHVQMQTAGSSRDRARIVDNIVLPLTLQATDAADPFQTSQVFPVIRNINYIDRFSDDVELITAPLAGDLVITYEITYPTHTVPLVAPKAADAGLTHLSVHQAAMTNLLGRANDAFVSGSEEGLYFIAFDGYHENALLLDNQMWASITAEVGPIIMAVPARDTVLFVPQYNEAALDILLGLRADIFGERTYGLSDLLFTWDNGNWVVLPE
ncbi:DUF1444 family protein [Yoonia sp. SS1-5]|uniref:DUF1444 family protein n=2 Tax=Yoonia rhodophyticola TaxID=3137370 RepID=A0AAN0NKH0_9RHOB